MQNAVQDTASNRIVHAVPNTASNRIAYFGYSGYIDPLGVSKVAAALNHAVNSGFHEAYLFLSSEGGFVGHGVHLYNHIRSLPIRVTMHNIGSVASIAVAVFVGATQRYCSAHANFMLHPTTLGPFDDAIPWEKLDSCLRSALAEDERTEKILRERTQLSDDILSTRRVRQVLVGPQQALQFGLVHAVKEFSLPRGSQINQI